MQDYDEQRNRCSFDRCKESNPVSFSLMVAMAVVHGGGVFLEHARGEKVLTDSFDMRQVRSWLVDRRSTNSFGDERKYGLRHYHGLSAWWWRYEPPSPRQPMLVAELGDGASASKTTDTDSVRSRLQRDGLALVENGSFCDSLCAAVAPQLGLANARALRHRLADWLQEQPSEFFERRNLLKDPYCVDVFTGRIWSDVTMLSAIATVFKRCIHVVMATGTNIIEPIWPVAVDGNQRPLKLVFFSDSQHYCNVIESISLA
jgi:hypothetical protein